MKYFENKFYDPQRNHTEQLYLLYTCYTTNND